MELAHLSGCFKHQMTAEWVTAGFFGNFSCCYKRTSFSDCSPSNAVNSRRLPSTLKLLDPPLHCMSISSSRAKRIVDVANCLAVLQPILSSNKNVAQICFLSHIVSIV